jgi:hypothetical protein
MKARCRSFSTLTAAAVAIGALSLVATAGPARSDALAAYQIQSLVNAGDEVGSVQVGPFELHVQGLNDQGQVLFMGVKGGSFFLAEQSGGGLVPIALPGQKGPSGKWPGEIGFVVPMKMNQRGSVAFDLVNLNASDAEVGMFRWDADSQQLTPLGLPGTPATDGLTFAPTGSPPSGLFPGTAINNRNEVAFGHNVTDAGGKAVGQGVFLMGQDGMLRAVALPAQVLPDGGAVHAAFCWSLNDAGAIGFTAQLDPSEAILPYLWENGAITAINLNIAGGGQIAGKNDAVYVNNHDDSALVAAKQGLLGPFGLYRWRAGAPGAAALLSPVLQAGQALPGGGTFRDLDMGDAFVITANDAGQYAFDATLTEGGIKRHGAYLLNPDGTLSLILKEGMTTALGTVTHLGTGQLNGVGLNRQGQVALSVQMDNGVPEIVLLTPSTP